MRFCRIGFLALLLCAAAATSFAVADSAPAACASPEYRSFDFWIGNWDAFDVSNPKVKVASNRVSRILGGCVLLEDYQGENGSHGESFSIYDAGRKVWHQNWVTNRGVLLVIEGGMHGDEMVLEGVDHSKGEEKLVRGTWKPEQGGVRETAVTSLDGGKTWTPWFDMVFRRAETGTSEEATLAALDTEYQAAVKINDAAVMDRILADDYVLVTGSGKTYSKDDLLEEARSGRVHYEHQEDTRAESADLRRFRGGHGEALGERHRLWESVRQDGVVQRHLCTQRKWMALHVRAVIPCATAPIVRQSGVGASSSAKCPFEPACMPRRQTRRTSGENQARLLCWLRFQGAGRLAQLVRAPRLHRGGRRFESCTAHHILQEFSALRKMTKRCSTLRFIFL